MPINKVLYGTQVLMDLTEDTVTADKLAKGETAHDASGEQITGTLETESGSGSAKTQILADLTTTELSASLSVTLEHNFHRLYAIVKCNSSGDALLVDDSGSAVSGNIAILLDTTSFGWNDRKVAQYGVDKTLWKNVELFAEWTQDLLTFVRGGSFSIGTASLSNVVNFHGGTTAMYGTIGSSGACAPESGRTVNLVAKGGYFSVGTRLVIWGEYDE